MVNLDRHRREKTHRQPIDELRVTTFDLDAEGITVQLVNSGEMVLRQIQPRVPVSPRREGCLGGSQLGGQVRKSDDMFAHQTKDRRIQPRRRQTLDLVYVVGSNQLPRAGLLEITQRVNIP